MLISDRASVMHVSCSYAVHTVHILNISEVVECPGAGKKLTVKCPGAGNLFCANACGCPGGGMVRVGIEQDIILAAWNLLFKMRCSMCKLVAK